jgi:hypothetical protein
MKRIASNLIFGAALLAFAVANAGACPLAYVVNFSGQFGFLDLGTGAFTPIGKGLDNIPDGIVGAPGGPLYTVDGFTGHLLRIGLDGKVTDIGDTKTGPQTGPNGISIIGSLTDGSLYALDFSNRLFKINKDTAALTPLGTVPGLPPQEMDYEGTMFTSLAGDDERLYFTIQIVEGPRKTGPTLFIINPQNLVFGLKASSKPVNVPGTAIGSGYINGGLYVFTGEGLILKVDPVSGTGTTVSSYDAGYQPDGPPLTGVFGAIACAEPSQAKTSTAKSVVLEKTDHVTHWPPRWSMIPARKE